MSLPRRWDDLAYVNERSDFDPPLECTPAEIELLRKDLEEARGTGKEPALRHDRPGVPDDLRLRLPETAKGKRKEVVQLKSGRRRIPVTSEGQCGIS